MDRPELDRESQEAPLAPADMLHARSQVLRQGGRCLRCAGGSRKVQLRTKPVAFLASAARCPRNDSRARVSPRDRHRFSSWRTATNDFPT